MEGLPNIEGKEGIFKRYWNSFTEHTGEVFEKVKGKAHSTRLALAAASLLGMGTVGCQVNIEGNVYNTTEEVIKGLKEQIAQANEDARNAPSRQKDDYHFEHNVEGHLGVGIDSSGQRHLKINHTNTETIYARGTAKEQEKNRQEAIRKEREDNK